MRIFALVCTVSVAGCASSPSSQTAPQPEQMVRVSGQAGTSVNLRVVASGGPNVFKIDAPLARVWAVLPSVYDSLAIPLTLMDQRGRTIGNEGFKIRRRLGTTALSKYLECGKSQMAPNADEYEITLSVISRAAAVDSQTTTVTTDVQASGKGLQFAGQFSQCTSKGALEEKLQFLLWSAVARR